MLALRCAQDEESSFLDVQEPEPDEFEAEEEATALPPRRTAARRASAGSRAPAATGQTSWGSYSRWLGPVIGPLVGGLIGARAARRAGVVGDQVLLYALCGAAVGLVAGFLGLILDPRKASSQQAPPGTGKPGKSQRSEVHETFIGRVLGVISIVTCWAPLLGLLLGAAALAVNWKSRGAGKILACIGLGLAVLMHAGLAILIAFAPDK